MVKKLSPLNPRVKEAVSEVVLKVGSETLDSKEIKETVEKAVKEVGPGARRGNDERI